MSSKRWVLVLTSIASLLVGLDALVVSTALTTIRADLGASAEQLQWLVNAYVLAFAVLLMPAAAWGDRFGRRRLLGFGLAVFVAASVLCALATTPELLIMARTLQGAGAAFVMPMTLALLTGTFEPGERPRALGIFASTTGVSVSLGPLIGGVVVQGVSWPWIFWLNLPLGLALLIGVRLFVPETERTASRVDLPGMVLIGVAALGLVWGLIRGNEAGWASAEVITAFVVGLVGLAGFLIRERYARAPMLPLSLFRSARFTAGTAGIFFLWGSSLGAIYFLAQFLQSGQGWSALEAGLRLAPWGLATVLVPRVVGRLIPRYGEPVFIWSGTALNAICLTVIAVLATPDQSYAVLVVPLILSGVGVAMAIPALQSLTLSSVEPRRIGTASGAFSMLRQLGGAAGVAAMVAGFGATGSYETQESFTRGFTVALIVGAVFAAVAGLAGLLGAVARRSAVPPLDLHPTPPAPSGSGLNHR